MLTPVVAAFNAAALTYDHHAMLQARVAERLLELTPATPDAPLRILDIGCGTGQLTERAQQFWPQAEMTALDAAPAMLRQIRAKLPHAGLICAAADTIPLSQRYNIILSSLVLHWLPQPHYVLQHWRSLLAPGGSLCVALAVEGSLPEWQALCAADGVSDGLWAFPPAAKLAEMGTAWQEPMQLTYPSLRHFLTSLKATGAHQPRSGALPIAAPVLRRWLRHDSQPFTVSYAMLYLRLLALP